MPNTTYTHKSNHISPSKKIIEFLQREPCKNWGFLMKYFGVKYFFFDRKKTVRAHVRIMFTASHDWRGFNLTIRQLQAPILLIGHPNKDDYHKQLIEILFFLKFCSGLPMGRYREVIVIVVTIHKLSLLIIISFGHF